MLDSSAKEIYFWSTDQQNKWGENVSESVLYVVYNIAPQQKGSEKSNNAVDFNLADFSVPNLPDPKPENTRVLAFLSAPEPPKKLLGSYTEILQHRRNTQWPELEKALENCRQTGASLLITALGTLSSNESFTKRLLGSNVAFYCLDQPFINQTILEALSQHAKVQKNLHGQLIRQGLKMTTAKSGNPNASQVISKVNKPKIDTAIVFAFLLQIIIQDYRRKGYSQRQMVKTLNEEGFTAPEGGKWVLSQLQKVLDRVRLNEIATELKTLSAEWETKALTLTEIAAALKAQDITPLKPPRWDESQVKKLQDRIQQIKDITLINRFVLGALPILHEYQLRDLSPKDMIRQFAKAGMPVLENDLIPTEIVKHPHTEKQKLSELERLKHILLAFGSDRQGLAGPRSLAGVFESAAKHMPVYLKIIKSHIEQLAKVLQLEAHSNRNLENAGLAEPVIQLMQLFRELNEQDIQLLETLAREAKACSPRFAVENLAIYPENALMA